MMHNIESYESRLSGFSWTDVENELEYGRGQNYNIAWYCSDRICNNGMGQKKALIHQSSSGKKREYTFNDIRVAGNTICRYLSELGITNGDRVCLFMDRIPELYLSFLGILKLGAIVQPLFSAFGDESLFMRLENAGTRAIITQRKHLNKVRKIKDQLPYLEFVIIADEYDIQELKHGEYLLDLAKTDPVEEISIFPALPETPSVLHYTSGTTGMPKGVVHVHNSILSQYITAKWILDLQDNDIYWCTADPGWVTGISYGIIGPWSLGVTQCIFDCGFSAESWYEFIEMNRITVWYTAPTAIRYLMKAGSNLSNNYDLSCLRHLCSVGEPLNPGAVIWSENTFGLPFHDTFWQTETGAIMISNYPGMKIRPGSMGKPFPGITAALLDTRTFEPYTEPGRTGLIAFKAGWPSMMRNYWNNRNYNEKFVNGWYLTGDKAKIDEDGYFWFIGRDDDVINTGGHLVSPFEVESAILGHPAVAESAVVSTPDDMMMEVVKAFITLKPGFSNGEDLKLEIMNFIRKKLSPVAMPQSIEFMEKLPRTRSGKIMRRLLHSKEWNQEAGDISALEED